MIKYKTTFSILIIFSLTISVRQLNPAEIDGIFFNNNYSVNSEILKIRGYSVLNYMFVIKAYAGALYLKSEITPDKALTETPRILELYYFHKISAEDFKSSTIEMIKKNTDGDEYSRIKDQIITFNRYYRDVEPGDRYRAEYVPGKGTTLYLNGKALGTINGFLFSKAFFSIWIGKNPIDSNFRDRLLGKE